MSTVHPSEFIHCSADEISRMFQVQNPCDMVAVLILSADVCESGSVREATEFGTTGNSARNTNQGEQAPPQAAQHLRVAGAWS